MRLRSHALAITVTAITAASIAGAQPPALLPPPDSLTNATFASTLGVDLARSVRLPSGVYMRELAVGQGDTVRAGARLGLQFRVRSPDGQAVADFRSGTESPVWFPGTYIRGVEAGLQGMRAGGQRQLVLPASLAYGGRLVAGLPVNSPVVIEVALATVR